MTLPAHIWADAMVIPCACSPEQALLVLGQRKLLGFHPLAQRKAALPPSHRQFNPTQPPALSPLPPKSPLALGQQRLC